MCAARGAVCVLSQNGQRFDWSRGEMFVVPSWAIVEHCAAEPSGLLAVTDKPMIQALELFREAYLDQPQQITGRFQPN
jgi:gentisate 1,2-dioxygenase